MLLAPFASADGASFDGVDPVAQAPRLEVQVHAPGRAAVADRADDVALANEARPGAIPGEVESRCPKSSR